MIFYPVANSIQNFKSLVTTCDTGFHDGLLRYTQLRFVHFPGKMMIGSFLEVYMCLLVLDSFSCLVQYQLS